MNRQEYPSLRQGLVFAWQGASPSTVLVDEARRNRGTWAGTTPTYQFGGVTFDGTGASGTNKFDITDRTGLSGNAACSVSAWFRPTSAYGTILNFGSGAILIRWDTTNNLIRYTGGTPAMSRQNVLLANRWQHVVFSYPGTVVNATAFYFNGVQLALTEENGAGTGNIAASYVANAAAQIGVNNTGTWHGGQIADVRIYNRAITAAEAALLASRRGIGLNPLPDRGGGLPRRWSVNVGGTWRPADSYINVGGTWKLAQPSVNVGGTWR